MMKNTKILGNGWAEATCFKCKEKILIELKKGEDFHVYHDGKDSYPVCAGCYLGPHGIPSRLKTPDHKDEGNDQ
jgi:hypothetical protein